MGGLNSLQFEEANNNILQAITDYQMGKIHKRKLLSILERNHKRIVSLLARYQGGVWETYLCRLERAARMILEKEDTAYLATREGNYHQVLMEIHQYLIKELLRSAPIIINNNHVVGWAKRSEVPAEVVQTLTRAEDWPSGTLVRKRKGGWMWLCRVGKVSTHYTVLTASGGELTVTYHDFSEERAMAVRTVMERIGLRAGSIKKVEWLGASNEYNEDHYFTATEFRATPVA